MGIISWDFRVINRYLSNNNGDVNWRIPSGVIKHSPLGNPHSQRVPPFPHHVESVSESNYPTLKNLWERNRDSDFDIQRYFDVYPIFQKFKNQSPTIQHFFHFNLQPDVGASVKACSVAWGPWSSFDLIHDVHGG